MVQFKDLFESRYTRFITDYRHWIPTAHGGATVPTAAEAWKYASIAVDAVPGLAEYILGSEVIEFHKCSELIGASELLGSRWMGEVRPALRAAANDSKVDLDRFARRAAAFYFLIVSAKEAALQQ